MSRSIGQRPDPHSPRATVWIVAAILLILHWAAPAAASIGLEAEAGTSPLGFSNDADLAQRGLAPRVSSRVAGFEAVTLKGSESAWIARGAPTALVAAHHFAAPLFGGVIGFCAVAPAPRSPAARGFSARAPPRQA